MKRIVVILLLVLLVPNGNLFLQEIPDCMCPPLSNPKSGETMNWDSSLVIDTCGIWYPSQNCDSVFWNNINSEYEHEARGRVYAKAYWDVYFDVDAIPLDSVRYDTSLYVTHLAIDSINYPDIKLGFRRLEENFGTYRLRKISPNITTGEESRYFSLYFDNYVKYGEIIRTLDTMEHVICAFANWPKLHGTNIINDKEIKETDKISLFPNPAGEYIEISLRCPTSARCRTSEIIEIYNVFGERVKNPQPHPFSQREKGVRLDVSDLPVGVYFVRIAEFVGRFVKY